MMVPAFPIANLVVGEARFALCTLDTFFNAMFGFGHSGELQILEYLGSHSTSSSPS